MDTMAGRRSDAATSPPVPLPIVGRGDLLRIVVLVSCGVFLAGCDSGGADAEPKNPGSIEQLDGRAMPKRTFRFNRHRHHRVIRSRVKQLPSVGTPLRHLAPAVGELPLAAGPRVSGDVDLVAAGLVRLVGHPSPAWREGRALFVAG